MWGTGLAIASTIATGRLPSAVAQSVLRSPQLLAQRLECRQVVPQRGAAFYSTLPQSQQASPSDYLPRDSRVSVDVTSTAIQAPDGRFYQFVTYPFGAQNTVAGYIPVQTQTPNGGLRNTLEPCRRRMW